LRSRGTIASRRRPHSAQAALAVAAGVCLLTPSQIGYQDIGAFIARQPDVSARSRDYVRGSSLRTVHVAAFGFHRPLGTGIPAAPNQYLASLRPDGSDTTGAITPSRSHDPDLDPDFPVVDRRAKGDRLPLPSGWRTAALHPGAPDLRELTESEAALQSLPLPGDDDLLSVPAEANPADESALPTFPGGEILDARNPVLRTLRVYFVAAPLAAGAARIEKWALGTAPIVASRNPSAVPLPRIAAAPRPPLPKTPAQRLGLTAKARAKAEKCLAEAVYFESRSEPLRGQVAVAQVVMNRVFSPFYPDNVCDVVYQNKHRYQACQFTFACDGIRDVVTEPDAWASARQIARDTLDGKLWLNEINKSTHYHASYVRPYWVREMKKMHKVGLHTFYRPRAWGDGSDEPKWGSAAVASASRAKL
jgi:hypothetical protein